MTNDQLPPNIDDDPFFLDAIKALDEIADLLEQPEFQKRYSPGAIAMALMLGGYKVFSAAIEDPAFLGEEAIARLRQGESKPTAYARAAAGVGSLLEKYDTETPSK